jgi:hypothetical protein
MAISTQTNTAATQMVKDMHEALIATCPSAAAHWDPIMNAELATVSSDVIAMAGATNSDTAAKLYKETGGKIAQLGAQIQATLETTSGIPIDKTDAINNDFFSYMNDGGSMLAATDSRAPAELFTAIGQLTAFNPFGAPSCAPGNSTPPPGIGGWGPPGVSGGGAFQLAPPAPGSLGLGIYDYFAGPGGVPPPVASACPPPPATSSTATTSK